MIKKNKKILIVGGDPNSINSEIIYKSWKKLNKKIKKRVLIIGDIHLFKKQFKQLKYPIKINRIDNINSDINKNKLNIININLKFKNPFKVEKKEASRYVIKCLSFGHALALKNNTLGLINCAISKKLLSKSNIGVTEFLAKKCGLRNNSEVMMIRNNKFSVCPITTHIDIKDITKSNKTQKIIIKVETIQKNFKRLFKRKPKIGILGLNPHNSELKKGSVEIKEIIPAIKKLKKKGYIVNGPLVSDTVFINDYKKYDIVVGPDNFFT